ncbi:alpha/beta fold hydrolase [soil metagenome]
MSTQVITLHGHRISYQSAGSQGPVLLLLHGMAGSSQTWAPVLPALGAEHRVIALDLLGYGPSPNPRGYCSCGVFASLARDLLVALDIDSATIVGHSLGGGIAMQFCYQYPELCDRLVLVDAGGLGRDVNLALRAVTLPGAEYVLPVLFNSYTRQAADKLAQVAAKLPLPARPGLTQVVSGLSSLADRDARTAFVHTLRGVLDVGGQRVGGADKFYLVGDIPLLLVWGGRDSIIPAQHGRDAHAAVPGSRLEIFERSGHFPQVDEPERFSAVLRDFVATSTAPVDRSAWRARLLAASRTD